MYCLRSFDLPCSTLPLYRVNMTTICFFRKTSKGVVLFWYMFDDIIIMWMNLLLITQLQQHLHYSFHMKDLGQLTYFLGLEICSDLSCNFLHQHKYTQNLITLA